MKYPIQEHEHSINGVPGRMFTVHAPQEVRGNLVHRNQTWKSTARPVKGYGAGGEMHVEIRFDDQCQNGHQSFSITATVYTAESRRRRDCAACGCMDDEVAKHFPELAPIIKWHLMSTDGPMHYLANTVYHAGDRDCNGLRNGEVRQIRNGRTGLPCWVLESTAPDLPRYVDSEDTPTATAIMRYVPMTRTGEGKERDLDAARSCAVWPEATDAELSAERDVLKAALKERLPALIAEFHADMERIGFLWEPPQEPAAVSKSAALFGARSSQRNSKGDKDNGKN
jgi:hypothetical protein